MSRRADKIASSAPKIKAEGAVAAVSGIVHDLSGKRHVNSLSLYTTKFLTNIWLAHNPRIGQRVWLANLRKEILGTEDEFGNPVRRSESSAAIEL
jgi:hypothetical protein